MIDAMKPMELLPKDILQFVENKAERAIEMLREMIDVPDYEGPIAQAVNPLTNITWTNQGTSTGLLGAIGMAQAANVAQQVAFNG